MARTTRTPLYVIYSVNPDAVQKRQVRGHKTSAIVGKAGMRVGVQLVAEPKFKKVAKRRASKRSRQEGQREVSAER